MKNIIPAIREILITDPAVTALVKSGNAPHRVYLMRAEQFTAGGDIIMHYVSGTMMTTVTEGSTGYWEARVSLECRASTYALAVSISDAVKAALLPVDREVKGLYLYKILHAGEVSDYSDEGTVCRSIVDFRVLYEG